MTEDKTTITDNEVIALFMGWRIEGEPEFIKPYEIWISETGARMYPCTDPQGNKYSEKFEFHSSWSWLMPVVEKLNKLLDEGHLEGLDLDLFRSMQDWITSVNIKYAYTDAVAIIRWYNSTQNKEQS